MHFRTSTLPDYDAIPYASLPIPESHPDRLAVIGTLFGLASVDPAQARILELGCAAGGNLLPIAAFLPDTYCMGVELSQHQAACGQERIAALALPNAEILHANLLDLPLEGEPFDYIIAHGVYSWVPAPVQEHLLALCQHRLSRNGIAYISYNCLPGSRLRTLLREMLQHALQGLERPRERLQAARAFLDFLDLPLTESPPGREWLQREVRYLREARDSYFYHEYLAEHHEPILFSEFLRRARSHELQYLADAQLHSMFSSTLGAVAEEHLSAWTELEQEEQYADFLRLRPFRQTLLCHADRTLRRDIDLTQWLDQAFYTDLQATAPPPGADASTAAVTLHSASGQAFSVESAAARQILAALSQGYPNAYRLADLPLPRSNQEPDGTIASTLFNLHVAGGLQTTRVPWLRYPGLQRARSAPSPLPSSPLPPPSPPLPSRGPRVPPLLLCLARAGEPVLPTPRHLGLHFDPLSLRIIALLDGTRSETELLDDLVRHAQPAPAPPPASPPVSPPAPSSPATAGTISSPTAGPARLDPATVARHLNHVLELLHRHGVLERPATRVRQKKAGGRRS
jgi:SAM-dependent methyltransferase